MIAMTLSASGLPEAPLPRKLPVEEIATDDFQFCGEKGVLHIPNVTQGVLLAAHNSVGGRGLLGHFSTVLDAEGNEDSQGAFARALKKSFLLSRERESLELWVGGVASFQADNESETRRELEAARHLVTGFVERHVAVPFPTESLRVELLKPGRAVDVTLDCLSASLVILKKSTPKTPGA